LQYLAKYQPFPYGIPPEALAYNFAKRAQVAQSVDGQKPLQVSPMVIDSSPNLQLESWVQQEISQARASEGSAFGIEAPENPTAGNDSDLAAISFSATPRDPRLLHLAIAGYDRAARLATDMNQELARHLQNPAYAQRFQLYASRIADAGGYFAMSGADRDYLKLRLATGDEARALRASAIAGYERALVIGERTVLTYYTEDDLTAAAFPRNATRESVSGFSDQMVMQIFGRVMALASRERFPQYDDERITYLRQINRASARLKLLQAMK
jgi:hypothetical protein